MSAFSVTGRAYDDEAAKTDGCYRIANYSDVATLKRAGEGLKKLYAEAGYCLRIISVPTMRADGLMRQRRVDGQVARTGSWIEQYGEQLAVVQPAFVSARILLLTDKGKSLDAWSPEMVKGQPVAIRQSTVWSHDWLAKHGAHAVPLDGWKGLQPLFDAGRVEYALMLVPTTYATDNDILRQFTVADLGGQEFYHVLSAEFADVAARLGDALEKMGGSAFMDTYIAAPELKGQ